METVLKTGAGLRQGRKIPQHAGWMPRLFTPRHRNAVRAERFTVTRQELELHLEYFRTHLYTPYPWLAAEIGLATMNTSPLRRCLRRKLMTSDSPDPPRGYLRIHPKMVTLGLLFLFLFTMFMCRDCIALLYKTGSLQLTLISQMEGCLRVKRTVSRWKVMMTLQSYEGYHNKQCNTRWGLVLCRREWGRLWQ